MNNPSLIPKKLLIHNQKNIMDRIHDLLHDSNLSVTGFNLVNLRFEFSDILRDPDGITRHGVMRFRAIILGTS